MNYATNKMTEWARDMERTLSNVAEDNRQEEAMRGVFSYLDPLAYPTPFTVKIARAFHGMLDERQKLYDPANQSGTGVPDEGENE